MNEKMENEFFSEKKSSIIELPEFQQFIKNRKISPENFHLIEKLAAFPKDLIILELHNLFNMNHERSGEELEIMIKDAPDDSRKTLYETAFRFYQTYGWSVSWNLVRLLEGV